MLRRMCSVIGMDKVRGNERWPHQRSSESCTSGGYLGLDMCWVDMSKI